MTSISTPSLARRAEASISTDPVVLERAKDADAYYGKGDLAVDVLRNKYLAPNERGPYHVWDRVAGAIASVEAEPEVWYRAFFDLLYDFRFVPGGRVMHGAGRDETQRKPTLSNCYVIPIEEDSLEGIYRCIYESAMVYRTGGGVGTDLSILRPAGAPVNATVAGSPGATSFMNLFSESTNTVSQAGRRGALMLTMRVDHPDIETFIRIKNDRQRRKVQYANVSVLITHEFMSAVLNDEPFELRWGGKVFRTVRARDLWNLIIENAHASAEPGIIFWDTMREYHNVEYAHPLVSTNPCVTGDTLVYTSEGLIPIAELAEAGAAPAVTLDGRFEAGPWGPASVPWTSGVKAVFRLKTREGYELRVTEDHKIMTDRGWVKARDLQPGDRLHILNRKGGFGTEGTAAEGRVLGWLIGDGHISNEKGHGAVLGFWGIDRLELAPFFAEDVNEVLGQDAQTARYPVGVVEIASRNMANVSSIRLRKLVAEKYGLTAENKTVGLPLAVFRQSEEFQRGLLQALFTADGYVNGCPPRSGANVRLTSVSLPLLKDAQRMLLNFGIASRIYLERYPARIKEIHAKFYDCKALHELVVSRSNVARFATEIGFLSFTKQNILLHRLSQYTGRRPFQEHFTARFESLIPESEEIVYDLTEPISNSFIANGLVISNCAEQPLAGYTACNLGSLNLSRFVREDGTFDHESFGVATRVATRFLDDVVEYNMPNHALDKIQEAVAADRRIGLGITGLGDALVRMKIKYDSEEALREVERMMQTLCYNAYDESIELAKEKGSFPLFRWAGPDGDPAGGVSGSKFLQGLPVELQEKIQAHGLRNSTVITVPPVGTGSIVAQSSSGIEPIFCTSYKRRVKQADGETFTEYKVYHPLIKELFGDDEELPDYVVTAHDIDAYFRVRMQGVVQKYVDSSISSTVNLPEDVSLETVADIYITAYNAGLKGITVYREGSREGILITDRKAGGQTAVDASTAATSIVEDTALESAGLRPRYRPAITRGRTERIRTGEGNLYVTINEDEQGLCEVFTTIGKAGGNAAAQSEAISRLISLCLRSGVDPLEIVNQLKGISGPTPVWDNGTLMLSAPDAIGKAIERYLADREEGQGELFSPSGLLEHAGEHAEEQVSSGKETPGAGETGERGAGTRSSRVGVSRYGSAITTPNGASKTGAAGPAGRRTLPEQETATRTLVTCPDCGGTISHLEGCMVCPSCGWSRC
jgi:ribonucleoside-diphosphate reductase alpha chain